MRAWHISIIGLIFFGGFVAYNLTILPNKKLPFEKALLTFRFDDGYKSQLIAIDALGEKNLKATLYCITGSIGKPGYIDWDELQAIAKKGFEIGSHTHTHSIFSLISEEKLEKELSLSKENFKRHNIIATSFAWPYGFSFFENKTIIKRYYNNALHYPWLGRFRLNGKNEERFSLLGSVPLNAEDFETFLNIAIRKKMWIIACFHQIGEKNERYIISQKDFLQIVDAAVTMKQKGLLEIVTVSEGVQYLEERVR